MGTELRLAVLIACALAPLSAAAQQYKASDPCTPVPRGETIELDFNGDLDELTKLISKKTCKNFIITNKIQAGTKFDIISKTPVTLDEAWVAYNASLAAHELAIVEVGRYYKIVRAAEATRYPVPFYSKGEPIPPDEIVYTKVYRLKHANDVNAVVNYLNNFKTARGEIHPFASTNTIIVTEVGNSIERLDRVMQQLDQPNALKMVHVLDVAFAEAGELAGKLAAVFDPAKPGSGIAKILPDERTNKLIVIADDASFEKLITMKRSLDVPVEGAANQIHVVKLKHATADELASTLASFAQSGAAKPGQPIAQVKPGEGSKQADLPAAAAAAAQMHPPAGAVAAQFHGEVKVTADKPTNSLLITAARGDFLSLLRVIELLDRQRLQVFLEAVIMETSIKNDRTLGLTWHGGIPAKIDGELAPIVFGNQPTQNFSSVALTTNPLGLASVLGLTGALRGPTLEGTETIIPGGIPGVGVVIQALSSSNDVNVVSTPHVLTLDNEEAEIQVNEKRPFSSGLSFGGLGGLASLAGQAGATGAGGALGALGGLGGLGLGSLQFNREDIGLTLKLKPQIHDDEYVELEIDQELSDVGGIDVATGQTITNKRKAKTKVGVRSQDSVVIGGLVRERDTVSDSKVPLLGDLPLIGWLFKRQVKVNERVNLVIVITASIIRGPEDFQKIFERKMAERKELVERFTSRAKTYEPDVDWTQKKGALASYRAAMRKELMKAENEGPGEQGDIIITP